MTQLCSCAWPWGASALYVAAYGVMAISAIAGFLLAGAMLRGKGGR
jgi:hypothetical protein